MSKKTPPKKTRGAGRKTGRANAVTSVTSSVAKTLVDHARASGKQASQASQQYSREYIRDPGNPKAGYGGIMPVHRWQKGVSGNPKGRPANMGRSVLEHLNDFGTMTEAEISRVAANPKEPASRRIAAKTVLNALQDGDNAMGEPIMGGYLDRIMDRTVGKPKQEMEITHGPAVDEERMKQLEALPLEQLKALRDKLAAAREALTPTVVTTGEVIEAKVLPAPADKGDGPDITGA